MANRGRYLKTHFGRFQGNGDSQDHLIFFVGTSNEASSHIRRVFDLTYFQGHRGQSLKFHCRVARFLAI